MNIVVLVKHVPDATADRRFESDNTVDRVGVDGLLSELDEYAVEQALQIKEKSDGDVTVTALCVGPEQALDAVRKALQMGADQGVLVSDDAIAGSDAVATSLVLAAAIKKMKVGYGTEDGITMGPLINAAAIRKVKEHIEDAVSKGAKIEGAGFTIVGGGTITMRNNAAQVRKDFEYARLAGMPAVLATVGRALPDHACRQVRLRDVDHRVGPAVEQHRSIRGRPAATRDTADDAQRHVAASVTALPALRARDRRVEEYSRERFGRIVAARRPKPARSR